MRKLCAFALVFLLLGTLTAHAQAPRPGAAQLPRLSGRVLDPSGAVMFGVDVKVFQGTNLIKEGKTDDRGAFSFEMPAGEYRVEVKADDVFIPIQQNIRVPSPALTIAMKIATLNTVVDAGIKKDEVSIDEDANLTSTTISGDKIKELPDDEDALMQQLQAIAGGSGAAGANATFVIDGISGGRVPPRDQIQSIIIDTNVFSAEGVGGPRIQIITKPGTGPWSGNMNLGFADESLNAKNPFLPNKPSSQQRQFNTNYGGPIIPGKLTMRFNVRESKMEFESGATHAITPTGPVNEAVFSPQSNRGITVNGQSFLTTATTLNFGFNYGENRLTNQGVSDFNLKERAFSQRIDNTNANLSSRSIVSTKIIYESRFSYSHSKNLTNPNTNAIQINVLGAFNSGGAQNKRDDRRDTYSAGQTLRWTLSPKLNTVSGLDLFYYKIHSSSEANYIGSYTFSGLDDFIAQRPLSFRKTSGNPAIDVKQAELAVFTQANYQMTPKMNIGAGLRYQVQTNFDDHNNLAPTLQLAYQLTKKTVIRTGGRLTYQTFNINNVEQLLRFDGTTRQYETVILFPSYPDPFVNGSGSTSAASSGSLRSRDPNLRAASNVNGALTVEQVLPKAWKLAVSYDYTRGLNVIRTRNVNAPFPGERLSADLIARLNSRDAAVQAAARSEVDRMRPYYPFIGNVNQYESTGTSRSKNLGLRMQSPNVKLYKIGFNGFVQYTLGSSKDNLSAANQYNWNADYAYSGFDSRHRVFSFLTFTLPKATNLGFFINGNSGNPYTITTGRDENGDQSANDRPTGYARNSERGPSRYNVDLNFSKTFTLKKTESANAAGAAGGAPQVQIRQFVEPQVMIGGPGVPIMIGAPPPPGNAGLKMSFSVNASNLFNNTQLRNFNGVQTSSYFRQATGAADGRKIRLGLNFSF